MKRLALVLAGVGLIAVGYLIASDTPQPMAADHGDPPAIGTPGPTDINDVYAWVHEADNANFALVATYARDAADADRLAQNTTYRFNIDAVDANLANPVSTVIDCTVNASDQLSCTGTTGGVQSFQIANVAFNGTGTDSGVSLFQGLRDDPFFFNLDGFSGTATLVQAAVSGGGLTADANGCPTLTDGTAEALLACLTSSCDDSNSAAVDNFDGENVIAISFQIPRDLIDGDGQTFFAVWTSVLDGDGDQIDRMGRAAIATATVGAFTPDAAARAEVKNTYNQNDDPATWVDMHSDDIEAGLSVLDSLNSSGPPVND